MTKQEIINHWLKQSELDAESMKYLFKGKKYNWALFIGHLVIEKLLKALFVQVHTKDTPVPRIHNLFELAKRSKLTLTSEQEDKLDIITEFNIEARYQNEKLDFYKICTKEYATKWIKEIEGLRVWLKNQVL